jgi:hypothetical protein
MILRATHIPDSHLLQRYISKQTSTAWIFRLDHYYYTQLKYMESQVAATSSTMDTNPSFEKFINALGGLHSRRVHTLLQWLQQQQTEASQSLEAEWELRRQQHDELMRIWREESSDTLKRGQEMILALQQLIRELDDQLACKVQTAPDAPLPATQVSTAERHSAVCKSSTATLTNPRSAMRSCNC